jgi:glycosyltransferase involved in cell wall biosynthesis
MKQLTGSDLSLAIHGGLHFQGEPFREQFLAAVAASQGAASWHGPYDRGEIARLMSSVAWVIVPSTWWENAPLVILEAFRHRRPVICSDIGGMAEMVEDGVGGLLFRAGDAADLARTMRRAASENGLLEKLQRGLPEVPELDQSAARHAELYDEVLAKDGVNPPPDTLLQHDEPQQAAPDAMPREACSGWMKRRNDLGIEHAVRRAPNSSLFAE